MFSSSAIARSKEIKKDTIYFDNAPSYSVESNNNGEESLSEHTEQESTDNN